MTQRGTRTPSVPTHYVLAAVFTAALGAARTTIGTHSSDNKQIAAKVLDGAFNRYDVAVIRQYVAQAYVQHNPRVADGRAGLVGFVEYLAAKPKSERPSVRIRRVLADGEFVVTHSEYRWGPTKLAVFDVFRLHNGKLVEHGDAIQEEPAQTANGHTMMDGPTAVGEKTGPRRTRSWRAVWSTTFSSTAEWSRIFRRRTLRPAQPDDSGRPERTGRRVYSDGKAGITVKYEEVKRVLGEGDLFLVQARSRLAERPVVFYDLFRTESGKIAEYRDVIQEIPAAAKNRNGMI